MTSKWLSKFVAAECVRAGALRDHVATFATALAGHGYAESTRKEYVRLASEFGRWLDQKGVRVTEVDERSVAEFLAHLQRRGRAARSHRATLRTLVSSLRSPDVAGPVAAEDAKIEANPIAEIECAFTRHLVEERGLHASTCDNYTRVARRLLSKRFRCGPVQIQELRADDVSRFVAKEARSRPRCMQVIIPALRVFLRWLHQRGDTETSLVGCVPAVANWRFATVPKSLPTDHVERLMRHCDRTTAVGRRDNAILLLLARLGLRAGEVVAMELDDLDWESGELLVRGKGGRQDRLPLPRDVGAAVAAYLRDGRPSCSTRRVFLRARAPSRGFVSSVAICDIVKRGLKRAELEPPRTGAHTLRHALACTMLRHGASLAEIGQILRHRSPDTTAIYAKVDLVALRALAPPWPQPAGDA
jgi:site-specific recombinase XerD